MPDFTKEDLLAYAEHADSMSNVTVRYSIELYLKILGISNPLVT